MFLPDGDHFLFLAAKFGNLKDDQSSGIYLVLSKVRRENLLPSADRVLATMPTICFMRMIKGSW